ncbi:hypothetical protein CesoFtcFv8_025077 [Champsocephalus esox]|uniref:Uncharacterized protein n=1 Tax=Champsocephalus esox TaxID=159716 RepID=A0AAN8B370_9TELE|nr:hypothetical protein CesoFtcFv8_025077 [Champsocephalus esox]
MSPELLPSASRILTLLILAILVLTPGFWTWQQNTQTAAEPQQNVSRDLEAAKNTERQICRNFDGEQREGGSESLDIHHRQSD